MTKRTGMMELHFSHNHPLIFLDKWKSKDSEMSLCYACQKTIAGRPIYCSLSENFYLHQKCAELPREIKHPMHPDHTLTLVARPPYEDSTCTCNVCREEWKWFTYHCFCCNEFDIGILCIMEEPSTVQLNIHHHPLTLKLRQASFHCDACDTEQKDFPYICTTCPTWIHKTCASSPETLKINGHDHPLVLSYSLPETFNRNFAHFCHICSENLSPASCVYHCGECRYLVHLRCATPMACNPQ